MKKNQSILVVDVDREIRVMLNHVLELEGYDVITSDNGGSALTLLEEYRPDLVLLDVIPPELNGFQVLVRIRHFSSVPVIMLSAICEVTTVRDALALGADDCVIKPFHTKVLLARIRAKLRRAGCSTVAQL